MDPNAQFGQQQPAAQFGSAVAAGANDPNAAPTDKKKKDKLGGEGGSSFQVGGFCHWWDIVFQVEGSFSGGISFFQQPGGA